MDHLSQRHQFFKERMLPLEVRKVKGSRPWLNVQQMLKRSGRNCVQRLFSNNEINGKDTFNFDDVSHLYHLYSAVNRIKSSSGNHVKLEICELKRGLHSWPYNLIIVPTSIRRKVDGFLQDSGGSDKKNKNAKLWCSGSLYKELRYASNSEQELNDSIARLSLADRVPPMAGVIHPGVSNISSKDHSPAFTLLWLECRRMGLRAESDRLINLQRSINDVQLLEQLGNALFFSLLYVDPCKDLFSAFFHDEESLPPRIHGENNYIQSYLERQKEKINSFVELINQRFLFNANKRHGIKKKENIKS